MRPLAGCLSVSSQGESAVFPVGLLSFCRSANSPKDSRPTRNTATSLQSVLTWRSMQICSVLEQALSGQLRNCTFCDYRVCFNPDVATWFKKKKRNKKKTNKSMVQFTVHVVTFQLVTDTWQPRRGHMYASVTVCYTLIPDMPCGIFPSNYLMWWNHCWVQQALK